MGFKRSKSYHEEIPKIIFCCDIVAYFTLR